MNDRDGDGVPDDKDQCPNTPAGDIVDAHGCTIYHLGIVHDRDGDGVPDDKDQCPNTPEGDIVDAHGCSIYHLVPISPPDFPYKVTVETKCTESIAGVCLRRDIIRVCIGGNCFDVPPRITGPLCLRCLLGAGAALAAALGVVGAILWLRRGRL